MPDEATKPTVKTKVSHRHASDRVMGRFSGQSIECWSINYRAPIVPEIFRGVSV
ncbi:hypothetical protein DPMN_082682 [Dreissena polymorpha]|uniref:Uncharacterized protein n=1 Tax=Dreissena polymorpha TaxID=45954 RepID=A0A9D3Y801_DREPO|nr:hypothetical protein DPMN_082682 [Dreissena polymorpha]